MPIKLVTARNKKTKNIYLRGTHLGVKVDQSSGTPKRSVARRLRDELEDAIERGEYPPRAEAPADREQPTFLSAALAYIEAGKRKRHLKRLIRYFGEKPLAEFDQAVIDTAAAELLPGCTPGARNAAVYTPVSAVLHHTLGERLPFALKRPKGAKGRIVTDHFLPEDAFGVIDAAETFEPVLAVLLTFLLHTGMRISEALALNREDLQLDKSVAWIRRVKGQPASQIKLSENLCAALKAHMASHESRRVFRFAYGGHLKFLLVRAKLTYLGLPCPRRRPVGWRPPRNRLDWANFHSFRHTWASWMRFYGGLDIKGLVATGNWRDERSASRYVHAVARDEWDRVNLLPGRKKA